MGHEYRELAEVNSLCDCCQRLHFVEVVIIKDDCYGLCGSCNADYQEAFGYGL